MEGLWGKLIDVLNNATYSLYAQKLIYFTDFQIARFVVQYLMFENKYYGHTGTINNLIQGLTVELKTEDNADQKNFIQKLFQLLVDNTIIGNIYEAISLFNWLKLEKVAFNKIQWQIIYTGTTGTGVALFDDMANNFCKGTDYVLNGLHIKKSAKLTEICEDNKEHKAFTFKVVGDISLTTSLLLVPTSIFEAGDALVNSVGQALSPINDIFKISDKLKNIEFIEKKLNGRLPSQTQLVNAVYEYLPTWAEIYSVYVNSGDLTMANNVYSYYVKNLDENGDFELDVSLYALRNYTVTITTELGTKDEYYDIYDVTTDQLVDYEQDGVTKQATGLTEAQMKEFVNGEENVEDCTAANQNECKDAVTTYKSTDSNGNEVTVNCSDDDKTNKLHGCNWGKLKFWGKLKNFAEGLEKKLREFWAGIKSALATGWYYVSNVVKNVLAECFPLTASSERVWAISVTKGTTFDGRYEWTYETEVDKTEEILKNCKPNDTFEAGSSTLNVEGNSADNNTSFSGQKIISTTTVAKTDKLKINQVTQIKDIEKKVVTYAEVLKMTSSKNKKYVVKKPKTDSNGNVYYEDVEYDNRTAYVIELINKDGKYVYNSDDYEAAYEAVRQYKGESFLTSGIYMDYSNLGDAVFGWPLASNTYNTVSDCFGERTDPTGKTSNSENHGGDDLPAPQGTKVLAAKAGKIIVNQYSGGNYGLGFYVVIEHDNGWYTLYGHMMKQSTLGVGTEVEAGQVIGYVGSTGRSTGNHLHFELRHSTSGGFNNATRYEPLYYIAKSTMPESLSVNCSDSIINKSKIGVVTKVATQ